MSQEYKERTDRILAELIDELVFEERQRILVEEKAGVRIDELEALARDLVMCVQNMCEYTLTVEKTVLPTLHAPGWSPSSDQGAFRQQRADIVRSLGAVSGAVGPGYVHAVGDLPVGSSSGEQSVGDADNHDAAGSASAILDQLIYRKHALLEPLCELQSALARCARKVQSLASQAQVSPFTSPPRVEAAPETPTPPRLPSREDEELRAKVDHLSRKLGTLADNEAALAPAALQAQQRAADRQLHGAAKLRACEMTIQALNGEISALHEKHAQESRDARDELARIRQQADASATTHQGRISECDTTLSRVSLELEQLINENAQLKSQLRAYQQPQSPGR